MDIYMRVGLIFFSFFYVCTMGRKWKGFSESVAMLVIPAGIKIFTAMETVDIIIPTHQVRDQTRHVMIALAI
jgi:hypothetical protein